MPRIRPLDPARLDEARWARVLELAGDGRSSPPLAGILGHHPALFAAHVDRLGEPAPGGLLGPRLAELVRLRSAELGGCRMCQDGRYDAGMSEAEAGCALVGAGDGFDERERRALRFVELMHLDHHAIDDAVYRGLGEVFTTAEVVELGSLTATFVGLHRWLHTLDLLGTASPVLPSEEP